ncbi:hypothetical protein RUM44_011754 [Polyplax serrata]|uniref:G-protein coupled receptors family 1 profile domain-containing protein n=1 Tax=Polyplax serrata TaxID=468196 RepID=A0ABR1AR01_POLSC
MLGDVNSTWNSQQEWTPEDLTIIVLYCCASLIGTAANVFVIVAVAGSSSRSRNGFILSLCLSDLLVCTLSMPLSVSTILIRFWTTGQAFCKVAFYFQSLPVAASTTSLMMLALDRYAIVKHSRILSKFRPQQMIITVWTGAALVTCPVLYAREVTFQQCKEIWPTDLLKRAYTLSHIALVYVIPCLTVASCHFSVGHKLCATSHPTLPLPLPLFRKPQHVIIVASVLPDSPSKMVPFKGNIDDEISSDEAVQNDLRTHRRPQLTPGRQSKVRSARSIINSNRKLRKIPPLVKQVSRQSLHSRRRLANMLVAMVVVFAICWAPYVCLRIYSETAVSVPDTVLPFCLLLGHTHSAINPLVYYLSNRQSLGTTLDCGFHWPWLKESGSSAVRRPPPSSTNEAALGVFHPSYTTKRYQPKRGCTNDYL